LNHQLEPLEKLSVTFYDYAYRCDKHLGRLGITIGKEYRLVKPQIGSIINKLIDEHLAVEIRSYSGFCTITVDLHNTVYEGSVVTPFRPFGE
jgi:hypothetical protein